MKLQEKETKMQELKYEINILQDKLDRIKQEVIENDNPFDVKNGDKGYYNNEAYATCSSGIWPKFDVEYYIPCKDKSIVESRQKRHHLADLLEKFAYDNDAVVTEDMWKDIEIRKFEIIYDCNINTYFSVELYHNKSLNDICFTSRNVAQRAIDEVVIPFNNGTL